MDLDPELLLYMLRTMIKIREFEEAAGRLAEQAKIVGAVHLSAGQEAVAVGVCANLNPADTAALTHRGHGDFIAKGADLKLMFAELFGRANGYCHGKGGSMHIADLDLGVLGANGIVGGGIPIAVGAAFAAKYRKNGAVCACFCGDGATNEGAWHEAVNLSALMKLPNVFIVENNHWGEFTRQENQGAVTQLSKRAVAYGIPGFTIDGQDVVAVYEAAREAVERARSGEGPTLIEADTYRYFNHTGMGERDPRPKDEIERWRSRDPIGILRDRLSAEGLVSSEGVERIFEEVRREIEEAIAFAEASPYPEPSELLTDIYS